MAYRYLAVPAGSLACKPARAAIMWARKPFDGFYTGEHCVGATMVDALAAAKRRCRALNGGAL